MKYLQKKAEMGVGTLIIFIAFLLVAAVAAGVLIQTAGSLQQKALSTGDEAEGQISTHAIFVEVSAADGSSGYLDNYTAILKLAPGSNPIKLSDTIFTFNTNQKTSTLKYRGATGTLYNNNSGFNTWRTVDLGDVGNTTNNVTLKVDLDDDGANDYISINTSHVIVTMSTAGVINLSLTSGSFTVGGSPVLTKTPISNGSVTYGYLSVAEAAGGSVTGDATFVANGTFILTPYKEGQGYYSVEYLQQGTNYINGNLQRGDVIKMYFESPETVGADQRIRLNFIPKIGTETTTEFFTPDVISTERVYLYP